MPHPSQNGWKTIPAAGGTSRQGRSLRAVRLWIRPPTRNQPVPRLAMIGLGLQQGSSFHPVSCRTLSRTVWRTIPAAGGTRRQGWSLAVRIVDTPTHPQTTRPRTRYDRAWRAGRFHFHPVSCRTIPRTVWKTIPAAGGTSRQGWSLRAVRLWIRPPTRKQPVPQLAMIGPGGREGTSFTRYRAAPFPRTVWKTIPATSSSGTGKSPSVAQRRKP